MRDPLTDESSLGGSRKTVTVLFCDLVDSTGLGERSSFPG
jgi:class 3 adenylate cyclase